jgi:pimeloyl-ACP methyl ester carboxylesterase
MTTQIKPKDKFVTTNGIKIHYLDWGNEGKPVMVLLHGMRGHSHSWDSFSEPMSNDYRVLALDQRGRGDTDWAKDGDYSTSTMAEDFAGFCEGLHLESFVLIGHSMGARNSMGFISQHPEKVEKLVIIDAPPANMPDGARIRAEIAGVPEEFDTFEDLYNHLRKENPLPPEEVLRRRLKYQTKELPNGKLGWKYDVLVRERMRTGTRPPSQDMWPAWRTITCPTLIVRGMETDALTPKMAKEMIDSIPHCEIVEIPRAHHMVFEENPDAFLTEVRRWLEHS